MCQSLITLSDSFESLTEHRCHGGVSILASSAHGARAHLADRLVVESGGFLRARNRETWQAISGHLNELKLPRQSVREVYNTLPVLTTEQVSAGRHLVSIAAIIVGGVVETYTAAHTFAAKTSRQHTGLTPGQWRQVQLAPGPNEPAEGS